MGNCVHLSNLDDLHGENTFARSRGAVFGVSVNPLRRARLRHAVEEATSCSIERHTAHGTRQRENVALQSDTTDNVTNVEH